MATFLASMVSGLGTAASTVGSAASSVGSSLFGGGLAGMKTAGALTKGAGTVAGAGSTGLWGTVGKGLSDLGTGMFSGAKESTGLTKFLGGSTTPPTSMMGKLGELAGSYAGSRVDSPLTTYNSITGMFSKNKTSPEEEEKASLLYPQKFKRRRM